MFGQGKQLLQPGVSSEPNSASSRPQGDSSMMQLSPEVLANVLQYLDPQQRKASFPLVCKAWRAVAATAAAPGGVVQLLCNRSTPPSTVAQMKADSLSRWLLNHGKGLPVNSITVSFSKCLNGSSLCPQLTLPVQQQLQQLRSLSLTGLQVLLEGSTGEGSPLAALSSLTSLHLNNCTLDSWLGGLHCLAALTGLCRLQLQDLTVEVTSSATAEVEKNAQPAHSASAALEAALPQLLHLTHLHISQGPWWNLEVAEISNFLSCLQQLRELRLEGIDPDAGIIAQLPATLTWLEVLPSSMWLLFDQASTAALRALTGLRHLQLPRAVFLDDLAAGAFNTLTQLTHLTVDGKCSPKAVSAPPFSALQQLQELEFESNIVIQLKYLEALPPSITKLTLVWAQNNTAFNSTTVPSICQLTGLQYLDLTVCITARSTTATLEGLYPVFLAQLSQLRWLNLTGLARDGLEPLLAALPQLQQLQHLDLSNNLNCVGDWGVVQVQQYSALLASTQLTSLEMLNCRWPLPAGAGRYLFAAGRQMPNLKQLKFGMDGDYWDDEDYSKHFGPGDIDRLVSCCPALEVLWISHVLQPGVQLSSLVQLSGLSELRIGGNTVDPAEVVRVLPQLTWLRQLEIIHVNALGDAGVCWLTRLTGLQELYVSACGLSAELVGANVNDDDDGDDDFSLMLDSEASPPDVWQQLYDACLRSKAAMAVMLEESQARNRQLLVAYQAHVAGAQQRERTLQQQLAQARFQLVETQGQLLLAQADLELAAIRSIKAHFAMAEQ